MNTKSKPGRIAIGVMCLLFMAEIARTLTSPHVGNLTARYLALFAPRIILFVVVLWHPDLPNLVLHVYFALQSALILALISLNPEIDFLCALFNMLSYQAALVFTGRTRWLWTGILALLVPGSLMLFMPPLRGLALGLSTMAFAIVLPAYIVVNEELARARAESQALIGELQERHQELQTYAGQVEELAVLEERNRLARELHDSVSQTIFSIILNTRSAQILLERDPARVRPQVEQLRTLTQNALAEMRGLIAKLRPASESADHISHMQTLSENFRVFLFPSSALLLTM